MLVGLYKSSASKAVMTWHITRLVHIWHASALCKKLRKLVQQLVYKGLCDIGWRTKDLTVLVASAASVRMRVTDPFASLAALRAS